MSLRYWERDALCAFVKRRKVARDGWKQEKINFPRHTDPGCMHLVIGWSRQFPAISQEKKPAPKVQGYAGSVSCRECHERFYQLWSTSFHGLAMQPYSAFFAKEKLTPHQGDIAIGKEKYRADINEG